MTIDIDAPDEAHFQQYGVELRENLTRYLDEKMMVEIQIHSYSEESMKKRLQDDGASDYGVSDYEEGVDGTAQETLSKPGDGQTSTYGASEHQETQEAVDGETDYGVSSYQKAVPQQMDDDQSDYISVPDDRDGDADDSDDRDDSDDDSDSDDNDDSDDDGDSHDNDDSDENDGSDEDDDD